MTRVQVRDLPDAPQLQATVQSGGNFGVSVEQAGSNKLTELANTLSGFNSALNEYKALAVTDAEMHSDELKWLSPEELTERLSKTEGELDSMSRKGLIPWLASPLNQKRKRRALGKAAHDVFVQRLLDSKGRLENPQEGDSDLTTAEIIEEERQAFISDKPALQQGTYGSEGFQEVLNPTILNLTRQYDGRKATVAKGETLLQNTSAIYRLAKDAPLEPNEYGLYMEQSLRAQDGGAGPWAELNSFNAAQQIKVIENVAEQLANLPGGEQRAYEFLQYAEDNFYVGNQLFYKNEDQVDRIMNSIEREVEAAQRIREGGRDERLESEQAEFVVALSAIQNTGKGTYKGVEYTDSFELLKAGEEFARNDDDVRFGGAAIQKFEQVVKGDLDTNQYQRELIRRKSAMAKQAPTRLNSIFNGIIADSDLPSDIQNNPQFGRIYSETIVEFENKVKDKLDEMIRTGVAQDPARAASDLDAFYANEFDRTREIVSDKLNKLGGTILKEKDKDAEIIAELSSNDTAPVPINKDFSTLENVIRYGGGLIPQAMALKAIDTPERLIDKTLTNLSVVRNKDATNANRRKSLQIVNDNKKGILKLLATLSAPNASRPFQPQDYAGMGFDDIVLGVATGGKSFKKYYSPEERKEFRSAYFEVARWSGTFKDIEVLKNKVTADGVRFEYGEDISSVDTLFTSPEQIERANKAGSDPNAVPADVKRIAEIVGESDDILKFIRQQDRLHKAVKLSNK